MTDKFDIKDYLNYSISGFLWILILLKFLDMTAIYKIDDLYKILQKENIEIYIVVLLLFGSYLIGNIFRFTDFLIIIISRILFGDLYSSALCTDRDYCDKDQRKEGLKKLGLYFYIFNKKPLGIGLTSSKEIESNLKQLKIFNKSKLNQLITCEAYLIMNYTNLKFLRLKDLKNLYESISFPFFIIMYWLISFAISQNGISLLLKITIIILLTIITVMFIDRYRFLKSNYIKDVYRYFIFQGTKISNSSK